MEVEGIEPSPLTPSKTPISTKGGAKCGALDDGSCRKDPELAKLIEAWPTLPEHAKTTILDLIEENTLESREK